MEKENESKIGMPSKEKAARKPRAAKENSVADTQAQRNRLWNFRQIIKSSGGTNVVARLMGKKNAQITQCGGPNPTRSIGNRMAADIERAFSLEPGSLDAPPPPEAMNKDVLLGEICSALANSSDEDRELVLELAKVVVLRSRKTIKSDDIVL